MNLYFIKDTWVYNKRYECKKVSGSVKTRLAVEPELTTVLQLKQERKVGTGQGITGGQVICAWHIF